MGAIPQFRQKGVTGRIVASHLTFSIPATAVVFGALGPLAGLMVLFAPPFIAKPDVTSLGFLLFGGYFAYGMTGLSAMATGAVVAAASPFVGSNNLLRLLAAVTGGLSMIVWMLIISPSYRASPVLDGSTIILAGLGAIASLACTQVVWDAPLRRKSGMLPPMNRKARQERRDHLARERAARLKRKREADGYSAPG